MPPNLPQKVGRRLLPAGGCQSLHQMLRDLPDREMPIGLRVPVVGECITPDEHDFALRSGRDSRPRQRLQRGVSPFEQFLCVVERSGFEAPILEPRHGPAGLLVEIADEFVKHLAGHLTDETQRRPDAHCAPRRLDHSGEAREHRHSRTNRRRSEINRRDIAFLDLTYSAWQFRMQSTNKPLPVSRLRGSLPGTTHQNHVGSERIRSQPDLTAAMGSVDRPCPDDLETACKKC